MIIYKTTNNLNGKIYIGQSVDDNPSYLGSGTLLLIEITNSGRENFTKEVIDIARSIDELNIKEKYWIQYYDSTNPKIGYNLSNGGTGYTTEKLNSKIQVLLSYDDLHALNIINAQQCALKKTRILTLSALIRNILKDHILANTPEQQSYVKDKIDDIREQLKTKNKNE